LGNIKNEMEEKSPWRKRILLSILFVIVLMLAVYIMIQISIPDVNPLINNNPSTTANTKIAEKNG
jgi:uncharacterized protein YxeA